MSLLVCEAKETTPLSTSPESDWVEMDIEYVPIYLAIVRGKPRVRLIGEMLLLALVSDENVMELLVYEQVAKGFSPTPLSVQIWVEVVS